MDMVHFLDAASIARHHFHGRLVIGKDLAVFARLANHAVQRFDGIRGVNDLPYFIRILKLRNQTRPVPTLHLADGRVFAVPSVGKGIHIYPI